MITTTIKILLHSTINPEIIQILKTHSELIDSLEAEEFFQEEVGLSATEEEVTTTTEEEEEEEEEEVTTENTSDEVEPPVTVGTERSSLRRSPSRRPVESNLVPVAVGLSVGSVLILLLAILVLLYYYLSHHSAHTKPQPLGQLRLEDLESDLIQTKTDDLSSSETSGSTSHSLTDYCSYCSADS